MTPKVALFPGEAVAGIARGAYTEILAIDAPSRAGAGERVSIEARVRNIWTGSFYIAVSGHYDGVDIVFSPDYANVGAGATHSFTSSFTMPSKDVRLHVWSFYWTGTEWYVDDYGYINIALTTEIGWQLLDTHLAGVGAILPEVGWQLLDSTSVNVKSAIVGWQLLDSRTIAIKSKPPVVGWQLIDEKAVGLTAGPPEEIPPEYELIQHTVYHFAYIYDGDVEFTTATFKTDPFTPSAWMADKFASKLEEEVRVRGGRPIEVKVYVDTSPLLWTNFRIEVSSTPLEEAMEAAPGIAVGIAPWLAIILVCLAIIAVIVVATLAFETIMDRIQHKPGLEDVKPAWGKEALILDIQDAEEYWERPLTPVETLEGMSEEDLRDHLDQIAEEEVPPEISPWAIVALVGGLGILGVGAAVALAARPKE